MNREEILSTLVDIGSIKFGNFTLKTGIQSPFYVDLRRVISYPKLVLAMSESLHNIAKKCSYEHLCGVPYTALPLATAISVTHKEPLIVTRKEKKDYGTKKMVEGVFKEGDRCIIIEDVTTSGGSCLQTAKLLEEEGLAVQDMVVFIDREQGAKESLLDKGYHLQSVFSISEVFKDLVASEKITPQCAEECLQFLESHQFGAKHALSS